MAVSDALIRALAVTAEVLGTDWSREAARVIAEDLAAYPEAVVLEALARCRRDVTGRLTLAAIIERVEAQDGRPGPEAAWAGCPLDEGETVVWTAEQRQAFGVASPLLAEGDRIAARMAFLEAYRRLVTAARATHEPVTWTVSLGHDVAARRGPIEQAVAAGRLALVEAARCLPADPPEAPQPPGLRALCTGLAVVVADRPGADAVTREGLATVRAELDQVDRERAAAIEAVATHEAARRAELREQTKAIQAELAQEAER